jgi:DNA-binding LacI/PurR family transcriptional regulator
VTDGPFLYQRIYDHVVEGIRNETFRAGDRVPSEKELAERFGVSRITSKRALALLAEAGIVDRQRGKGSFVADAAPQLGASHAAARSQSRRGSGCLALILPNASDSYGLELLYAVAERCDELGLHLILKRTKGRQDAEERAIQTLIVDGAADGLIVFPVHGDFYNASLVRLVFDHSPLVLVDRQLQGIPACSVFTDNVAAARTLTEYLLDRGYERPAFISPPAEHTSTIEQRIQGYELAIRGRGTDVTPLTFTDLHSTLPGHSTDEGRRADKEALRDFVLREPSVAGFVVCEYSIAVMLREVLDDVGGLTEHTIACFDSPNRQPWGGKFLHIKQDQRSMGRKAVDLLVAQINGDDVPLRTVIPFSLIDPTSREDHE